MQSIPLSGLPIAPAVLLPTDMLMMCRDGVTLEKVPYSQVAQALGQMYWGSLGAFTVTTANFTQPSSAGTVSVSVVATAWMSAGQFITIASGGLYQVSSITNSTTVVLLNTGWTGNAAASTVIPASSAVAVGGAVGPTGSAGTNGVNAYTTLTASFTQPAVSSTVAASVASTAWMSAGQVLYVASGGYYSISSITNITTVVLTNLGYAGNASPTSTVANASAVSAAGLQAPSLAGGTLSGALNDAAPVSIASASTVAIGAAASNQITITGTTAVTGFDTIAAGAQRWITAAAALPITVGSISLTMAAGDVMLVESLGGGAWKMQGYFAAGGAWQGVTSINGGPLNGNHVDFLNGDMSVSQAGTSFAVTSAQYTLDGWIFGLGGTQTCTVSQVAYTGNFQYALRLQRNSGTSSTAQIYMTTSWETKDVIKLAGKTVTVSFRMRAGANFSAASNLVSAALLWGTGTDGNSYSGFTGQTLLTTSNFNITTSDALYVSTSVTIPSNATQLGWIVAYYPTGTAGANDYFDLTGVQLDVGPVAQAYRPISYAANLWRCMRYQYGFTAANAGLIGCGYAQSTTTATVVIALPVPFRVSPTGIAINSPSNFSLNSGSGSVVPTALTFVEGSPTTICVNVTVSGGYSAGAAVGLFLNAYKFVVTGGQL